MTAIALSNTQARPQDRWIVILGTVAGAAIALAFFNGFASGALLRTNWHDRWLTLHLLSVIPALPLGGYVLLRRKGDGPHRMLGRIWAVLMLVAALSSFGLHRVSDGFSPIHLLSILVLVSIPRAILQAMRGDIAGHRRTMTLTYLGLCLAGLFTLLPGRLLGSWLLS